MRSHPRHLSPSRRGFTLVELLVVVGIIVALVALLIPALGHVKRKGYDTATSATLMGISKSVDTYYSTFNGYPGPLNVGSCNASTGKVSGAQNMLLGLCYPMLDAGAVQLPGGGGVPITTGYSNGIYVNPSQAQGPRNYAQSGTGGLFEQLQPFFPLNQKSLSPSTVNATNTPVWPSGGVTGTAPSNSFAFPVLMDNYPDGLPILFYRRTPGVSAPFASDSPASGLASYFLTENSEYTSSPSLTSTSGVVYDQTKAEDGSSAVLKKELIAAMFRNHGVGGYFLLSAGPDRRYGVPDTSPGVAGLESDNIFQIGGN